MPGCGQDNVNPEAYGGTGDHSKMVKNMPGLIDRGSVSPASMPSGPFNDTPGLDTNKPFVRDMRIDELEELIEKCVRRVLQGEDIKREFERLKVNLKPGD